MGHQCAGLAVCLCKRLRALGIKWIKGRLADGYDGWYDNEKRTITTDERLSWPRTRWVLAHELVHAQRGDTHAGSAWAELKQERSVDLLAARMLIPLEDLANALAGATDEFDVAERLVVDIEAVRARLADLTTVEHEFIDLLVNAARPDPVGVG